MRTAFFMSTYLSNSQLVTLDAEYTNVMLQGTYFYYQLQPNNIAGYGYLDSLTISLQNMLGDAELLVSTSTLLPKLGGLNVMSSLLSENFESITFTKGDNSSLNNTLYIGIYATTFSVYKLSFVPVYSMSYDVQLNRAVPLTES